MRFTVAVGQPALQQITAATVLIITALYWHIQAAIFKRLVTQICERFIAGSPDSRGDRATVKCDSGLYLRHTKSTPFHSDAGAGHHKAAPRS